MGKGSLVKLTLAGMVGATQEQAQDLLTFHLPVLENEVGELLTPTREKWREGDLRPIRARDQKFITRFDREQLQLVQEGCIVFVVGATFYNRCSRIEELREFSDGFHSWEILTGPFSWRAGSREEFNRLNNRMLDALEAPFYEALFGRAGDRFVGDAERLFWVLERLSDVPQNVTLLMRGLYYRERRDVTRYELLSQLAATESYGNVSAFKSAVEERAEWLSRARLHELPAKSASDTRPRPEMLASATYHQRLTSPVSQILGMRLRAEVAGVAHRQPAEFWTSLLTERLPKE